MTEPTGPAQSSSTQTSAPAEEKTNVKETVESILVAFVLAFIFRAFVVEAFVIPTGSMAPTLLGAHLRYQCPDCGWTFTVNYSARSASDDEDMRTPPDAFPTTDIYCPNCGRLIADSVWRLTPATGSGRTRQGHWQGGRPNRRQHHRGNRDAGT